MQILGGIQIIKFLREKGYGLPLRYRASKNLTTICKPMCKWSFAKQEVCIRSQETADQDGVAGDAKLRHVHRHVDDAPARRPEDDLDEHASQLHTDGRSCTQQLLRIESVSSPNCF